MRINNNISAVMANHQLSKSEHKLSKSLERLSSGLKINRSADNPAGMAISQKMRTQIKGLSRASQNSMDGISVVETAEGALAEVTAMLQRMRELAVQAGNDSYTSEDKQAIQEESNALAAEIDRISTDTEFNKITLLDGGLDQKGYTDNKAVKVSTFSTGVDVGKYTIEVVDIAKKALADNGTAIDVTTNPTLLDGDMKLTSVAEGSIVINGTTITLNEGDTAEMVAEKLREGCELANVKLLVVDANDTTLPLPDSYLENGGYKETAGAFSFSADYKFVFVSQEYGSSEVVDISCSNSALSNLLGLPDTSTTVPTGKDTIVTIGSEGFNSSATVRADGTKVVISDRNGFSMELEIAVDSAVAGADVELDITSAGTLTLQVGANEGQTIEVKIPEVSTKSLGIDKLNYITSVGVGKALERLDGAIEKVSYIRSQLGACQNRLEHANASLAVTEENMTGALSRIEDVDMAKEMATYTQLNVLTQAGTSMLAQANDLPQTVLQLLQ